MTKYLGEPGKGHVERGFLLTGLHDFVAGGQDGDGDFAEYSSLRASEGGQHGYSAIVEAFSRVQHDFPGGRLAALRVDELVRLGRMIDADTIAVARGVLYHH